MILRRRRAERGSIELLLPELKILLDQQGKVVGARRVEYTESHQIIEEFMLAANEAVAERLRDEKLLFLRRVHDVARSTKAGDPGGIRPGTGNLLRQSGKPL